MARNHKHTRAQRLIDARGRPLIQRRGVKRVSLAADAYHLLRTTTWPRILGLFFALFVVSNLVFAVVFDATGAVVTNAHSFLDYVWFSVQTMATIGYGYLAPSDHMSNAIVAVESFYAIIFTALVTGVFFARFSTPSARVIFSKVALITTYDGKRVLMFRMANERTTAIVEATVRAYLTREERIGGSEILRRVYDLPLRRTTSPVFALSFLAVHIIDETSPLYRVTTRDLRETETNVVVTFTGIDDQLASSVHSRWLWTWNDIEFDRKFKDLFTRDEHGHRILDLGPMHDTVELEEINASADPA
ncbi:MAG TPA: ion channel [Kofleriaceae bacterium]